MLNKYMAIKTPKTTPKPQNFPLFTPKSPQNKAPSHCAGRLGNGAARLGNCAARLAARLEKCAARLGEMSSKGGGGQNGKILIDVIYEQPHRLSRSERYNTNHIDNVISSILF